MSAEDEAALERFMSAAPAAQRTLGDILREKITEKQTEIRSQMSGEEGHRGPGALRAGGRLQGLGGLWDQGAFGTGGTQSLEGVPAGQRLLGARGPGEGLLLGLGGLMGLGGGLGPENTWSLRACVCVN